MNCNEAGLLVARYADGEIDGLRGRSIERHLRSCTTCAEKHRAVLALRQQLRTEVPTFKAPPALRANLIAMAREAQDAAPSRPYLQPYVKRERWHWLTSGALGGCMATVLVWVIGSAVINWRANEDLPVEAVATHVRATLNNHLIDVVSSDQHTVKPWLSARLDYSPPVPDMSASGFTLTGGRLDTLDKQRVATLVYRYRLHTIDVFVRPEAAHAPSALRTVRGFNVAPATGSGMDWLAVSDVSSDVLTSFVQQLARANGTP